MLPTLNLQFTSLETLDATLTGPAIARPGSDALPAAGFAELLRLRVDGTPAEARASGQFLPQAGSRLPAGPDRISVELIGGAEGEFFGEVPTTTAVDAPLRVETAPRTVAEAPQIELDVPVRYPVPENAAAQAPLVPGIVGGPLPTAAIGSPTGVEPAAPVSNPAVSAAVDTAPRAPAPVELPIMARQSPARPPADAPATPWRRVDAGRPELGPQRVVPPVTARAAATEGIAVRDDQRPVIDVSRRPETPLSQGAATGSGDFSDVFKARPAVVQTVQVLNAQANPQQPQPVFTTTPAVTPSAEPGYAAAAQQASDLISVPVRDAAWGNQLGERVLLMAGNQARTAEIRLTPAELGPLRVQVTIDDGQANVTFQAQHVLTREAIEQALPRLRELFAENGLSLGQANVGEQGVSGRSRDQEPGAAAVAQTGDEHADAADASDDAGAPARASVSNGLVDTFA